MYGQAFDRQHTEHSTFDPSMLGQYTYGQPQLVTRAYYYHYTVTSSVEKARQIMLPVAVHKSAVANTNHMGLMSMEWTPERITVVKRSALRRTNDQPSQ